MVYFLKVKAVLFFFWGRGIILNVPQAYLWLCTLESLLEGLRGQHGIKFRLSTCKSSACGTIISGSKAISVFKRSEGLFKILYPQISKERKRHMIVSSQKYPQSRCWEDWHLNLEMCWSQQSRGDLRKTPGLLFCLWMNSWISYTGWGNYVNAGL